MIGSSLASQMVMIEDKTMNQNIEQVGHPRDAISKELYDTCIDRLTGADKLAEQLDGLMANSITKKPKSYDDIMSDIRDSLDSPRLALLKHEPFMKHSLEWPTYLDRSYMISIDVNQLP